MKFGNYDTASLTAGLGPAVNKIISGLFWGTLILIVVGVISWYVYKNYRDKTFYTTPVTLTRIYDNGTKKDKHDLVGGKFVNSKGVWDFKIKTPKIRRQKELGYMPDFSLADSDGRIHFITAGDDTIWQQYDTQIVTNEIKTDADGTQTKISLLVKPVPTDVKTITINSIKNWRETVDKSKVTTFAIAIGGFIIMVIAHLISLFIQTKIKCGA